MLPGRVRPRTVGPRSPLPPPLTWRRRRSERTEALAVSASGKKRATGVGGKRTGPLAAPGLDCQSPLATAHPQIPAPRVDGHRAGDRVQLYPPAPGQDLRVAANVPYRYPSAPGVDLQRAGDAP